MRQPTSRLVLASASARRTDLLREWGIDHEVCPSALEELLPAGLSQADSVVELARQKAAAIREEFVSAGDAEVFSPIWVLGADTLVFLGEEPLGKPHDDEDAFAMLRKLSGREVSVITGVVLLDVSSARIFSDACTSVCVMRSFGDSEAKTYVETGEPRGKAGSFAIQGRGAALISALRGSRSNVIGLPRETVLALLRNAGLRD